MHPYERFRPSSTGSLIQRVLPDSRQHLWFRERRLTADDVRRPGRELWILHPNGEPVPADPGPPEHVQLLLLDGSWREAAAMAHDAGGWGRTIRLQTSGESRYWLRTQAEAGRLSTVEALLLLMRHFGLHEPCETLGLQFELHVYAGLRARGRKAAAQEFLATSPIATAFPELIAALDVRRPH